MKRIGAFCSLALLVLPMAAQADDMTCDTANMTIFRSAKTVLSNKVSLSGLLSGIEIATAKNDADKIHELLTGIKSRCEAIIQAARDARTATDAINGFPDHCKSDQAQIDDIRASMDKEIADCTAVIEETDKN